MSDIKFWNGNTWIDPCDTEVNVWTGSEWKKLGNGDAIWSGSEWKQIICTTSFDPFDYAVVRYIWTSAGGNDLDTKTNILDISGLSNLAVGFGLGSTVPTTPPEGTPPFLKWGGDNTGAGVEAVLIDFKTLKSNYPDQEEFKISLAAHWYSKRESGDMEIEFETYLGGTMESSETYDFKNVNGTEIDNTRVPRNVANTKGAHNILGTLVYNVSARTAVLQ